MIIDALGAEHMRTGAPIVYTSADSVFQIAAHEEVDPDRELYRICDIAFELAARGSASAASSRGRSSARPGASRGRPIVTTSRCRRRAETLLDRLTAAGMPVLAIGKIHDLFAGRGITRAMHTASDDEGMDAVEARAGETAGLIFANLVDFDTLYGHRNESAGYAAQSRALRRAAGRAAAAAGADDLLIITADHGNDPTTPSTDHSREYVPLLVAGAGVRARRRSRRRARRSPTSARRSPSCSVSARWRTAPAFWTDDSCDDG